MKFTEEAKGNGVADTSCDRKIIPKDLKRLETLVKKYDSFWEKMQPNIPGGNNPRGWTQRKGEP